jgi:hypothetical protein
MVAHGPANRSVKRRIGLVPGADLNVRTAAGALLIANTHSWNMFAVLKSRHVALPRTTSDHHTSESNLRPN